MLDAGRAPFAAGRFDAGVLDDDAGYPVGRKGLAPWAWVEIAGTSMTMVTVLDPFSGTPSAPTQRIDAWNGLAANRDSNRIYLANAGGHADWAGNEAYEIDLQRDHPQWKLLRGSTMAPDVWPRTARRASFITTPTAARVASVCCRARRGAEVARAAFAERRAGAGRRAPGRYAQQHRWLGGRRDERLEARPTQATSSSSSRAAGTA